MEDYENLGIDLPYFDFTTGEYPNPADTDDWFFRFRVKDEDDNDDELGGDSRPSCPSPRKKQRTGLVDDDKMPRRSPRLKATPITAGGKLKSSEELELERIGAMRKQFAKAKREHEVTYKKAQAHCNPVLMKSSQPPTKPQGFHFHSDQRMKGTAEIAEETSVVDFAKMLRSTGPSTAGASKGNTSKLTCTRPQPFNFSKSTSSIHAQGKYKSTAEQVLAYKDNFRSGLRSARRDSPSSSSSRRAESHALTIAKTPNLSTRGRSRSQKHLTREEEEEIEYEKHRQQQFKAHGVNHKIFQETQLGVPKVPSKPPTTVKEFNLHTSSSVYRKGSNDLNDEKAGEFHANPVNHKILDGPIGIKPVEKRSITVPQSPAFTLKNRLRTRERHQPMEEVTFPQPPKLSSRSVPHMGVPFRPQLEHKYTVTKPFAVEQHSKDMLKKKEQKIQQVFDEEKKAREFTANGLPSDSPDQLPPRKTKPVTSVEPFKLTVDERGNKYQQEWKSKIEEQEEQARSKAQFHASANRVVFKAPFVPDKSDRPLTEMSSFTLNTDQRAVKREFFNQRVKNNEAQLEALKRQRDDRNAKEEKEAVAQLRQEMVPKATTIKKYKHVTPQPSDKPLTMGQSPCLKTQRLRSTRHHSDD